MSKEALSGACATKKKHSVSPKRPVKKKKFRKMLHAENQARSLISDIDAATEDLSEIVERFADHSEWLDKVESELNSLYLKVKPDGSVERGHSIDRIVVINAEFSKLREQVEGMEQVGWYDRVSKRMCDMNTKETGRPEMYGNFVVPLYAEKPKSIPQDCEGTDVEELKRELYRQSVAPIESPSGRTSGWVCKVCGAESPTPYELEHKPSCLLS
jgi:hypothetical protein